MQCIRWLEMTKAVTVGAWPFCLIPSFCQHHNVDGPIIAVRLECRYFVYCTCQLLIYHVFSPKAYIQYIYTAIPNMHWQPHYTRYLGSYVFIDIRTEAINSLLRVLPALGSVNNMYSRLACSAQCFLQMVVSIGSGYK
jgi:hypothetical protein